MLQGSNDYGLLSDHRVGTLLQKTLTIIFVALCLRGLFRIKFEYEYKNSWSWDIIIYFVTFLDTAAGDMDSFLASQIVPPEGRNAILNTPTQQFLKVSCLLHYG